MRFWVFLAGALALAPTVQAAPTIKLLYSFCPNGDCGAGGGYGPSASPVADASGTLYGTLSAGGHNQNGAIYKLVPGSGGSWTETEPYKFCLQPDCADGSAPQAPLVADGDGNLYGTTLSGGAGNGGVVFELTKDGEYKVLYSFCAKSGCADGTNPEGGLAYLGQSVGAPYDGISPLYGTTFGGGSTGQGAVFRLTPPAAGKTKWKQHTIYSFCKRGGVCTSTGGNPGPMLIVKAGGDLYGTTTVGGRYGAGVAFELFQGANDRWTETVLHRFCGKRDCADGGLPIALLMDQTDTLYGLTDEGGNQTCGGGCGTVFRLVPNGTQSQLTTLHKFCALTNCADGYYPNGTMVLDASGNLYGTTFAGGDTDFDPLGGGVFFKLSGTAFTVLHAFCTTPACNDGENPAGGVASDGAGHVFGTASAGGANGSGGEVFELVP